MLRIQYVILLPSQVTISRNGKTQVEVLSKSVFENFWIGPSQVKNCLLKVKRFDLIKSPRLGISVEREVLKERPMKMLLPFMQYLKPFLQVRDLRTLLLKSAVAGVIQLTHGVRSSVWSGFEPSHGSVTARVEVSIS